MNQETKEQQYEKLRLSFHNFAVHSFGFAYIFDNRSQKFSKWINLLKVFGLVVPSAIGATALGYGLNNEVLSKLIVLAVPLTIIQFIFSVFAVIYKWDDELAYSYEASQDYNQLNTRFKRNADYPCDDLKDLQNAFDLIHAEYTCRSKQDSKHNLKEWELRKGMRYALREYQIRCKGCNEIPLSMESSECSVCGKY